MQLSQGPTLESPLNTSPTHTTTVPRNQLFSSLFENGINKITREKPQNWEDHSDDSSHDAKDPKSSNKKDIRLNTMPIEQQSTNEPKPTNFLPPGLPLAEEKYSLLPDMIFGWKPKMDFGAPIPLKFRSGYLDRLLAEYCSDPEFFTRQKGVKLVYCGFRPADSFKMHAAFQGPNTYTIPNSRLLFEKYALLAQYLEMNDESSGFPFKGMSKDAKPDDLVFDGWFESGNLDAVFQTKKNEFDLFMRADTNTRGHTYWYEDFLRARKCINEKENLANGKGWLQSGENISFTSYSQVPYDPIRENGSRRMCKLSFDYTFQHDDDVVSFATCVPYTYSQLLKFLREFIPSKNAIAGPDRVMIKESKLCLDLSGAEVPLLTITEDVNDEHENAKKKVLIATGRVHPGESNSSWVLQGFLEWSCSDDPGAKHIREKMVLKIVPMLNPDGVIVGNFRTGLAGNDLNRQFESPNEKLHPTVFAMKRLVEKLQGKGSKIWAYMDFHGHSLKKNVFIYAPQFPVHSPYYYKGRVLPKIISEKTDMFRYYSCIFRICKSKMTTARAVFAIDYGINNCFTIESSFANYMNQVRATIPFNTSLFVEMGRHIAVSCYEYLKLLEEEEAFKVEIQRTTEIRKKKKEQERRQGYGLPIEQNTSFNRATSTSAVSGKNEGRNEWLGPVRSMAEIVDGEEETKQGAKGIKSNKSRPSTSAGMNKRIRSLKYGSEQPIQDEIASKKKKKPMTANKKKSDQQQGPDPSTSAQQMNLGIYKYIENIKSEMNHKQTNTGQDSEGMSEGGSDSESSVDDLDDNELKEMQKEILSSINMFSNFVSDNTLPKKNPRKIRQGSFKNYESKKISSYKQNIVAEPVVVTRWKGDRLKTKPDILSVNSNIPPEGKRSSIKRTAQTPTPRMMSSDPLKAAE